MMLLCFETLESSVCKHLLNRAYFAKSLVFIRYLCGEWKSFSQLIMCFLISHTIVVKRQKLHSRSVCWRVFLSFCCYWRTHHGSLLLPSNFSTLQGGDVTLLHIRSFQNMSLLFSELWYMQMQLSFKDARDAKEPSLIC
ncbi:hypothetical protein ANPL_03115 [Anaplasma platys]|uniref:Uncharacterized protein n=1 Tax=Anaplasma platys TaxID=949 RepID=A0A858PYK6_9RICK|nr:hypothetical protein ANPL_03115 [Anaplasma platys]